MGINIFISLYTTRLILNSLGASDFGIFNVVGGAIAMLGFLNASMASATQRFMNYVEGEGDLNKKTIIFNNSIILHFIIACSVVFILLIIKPVFFNYMINIPLDRIYAAEWIYYFTIVSTAFTVMTVPYDAVLNSHENMLYYAIVGLFQSVLNLIVALIVTNFFVEKLIVYGGLMAFVSLIVMIIMRVYCMRNYVECQFKPQKYFNLLSLKSQASFAGWNLLGSSSSMISFYGSNLVLNNFFGTILNAAYGICNQLNGQLRALSGNLLKAVNPIIVKSEGSNNRNRMYKATFSACKLSLLMYSVLAIPFIIECDYILKLWLKTVPDYTNIFCQFTILQVFCDEVTLPLGTVIGAIGKIRKYNVVISILQYANVIFLFIGFSIGFSPIYMIVLGLIVAIITASFKIFYCDKYCDMKLKQYLMDVLIRSFITILISFMIGCAIHFMLGQSFLRLTLVVISCAISFAVLFYFVSLTKDEKESVRSLIKKIKTIMDYE